LTKVFCFSTEQAIAESKELPSVDQTSRINAAGTSQIEVSVSPNLKERRMRRQSFEEPDKDTEKSSDQKDNLKVNFSKVETEEHEQPPSNLALQQEYNLQAYQAYLGRMPAAAASSYMGQCFAPNDYMAAFQRQIITHQNGAGNAQFHFGPSMDCYMPRPIAQPPNIMSHLNGNYNGVLPSLLYSHSWNFSQPAMPLAKLPISTKISNVQTITK